jgi:hypothetical protein
MKNIAYFTVHISQKAMKIRNSHKKGRFRKPGEAISIEINIGILIFT